MSNEIRTDSAAQDTATFERLARECGWQTDEYGIVHPNRDGNNTDDEEEYASSWQEACEISGLSVLAA